MITVICLSEERDPFQPATGSGGQGHASRLLQHGGTVSGIRPLCGTRKRVVDILSGVVANMQTKGSNPSFVCKLDQENS